MTVFGVEWADLTLGQMRTFLEDAGAEPLRREAKGIEAKPGEVRKQVCGFANSHDGGYLILGASERDHGTWALDGVEFPNDDPPSWVSSVIGDGDVTPYPDGLDTRWFRTAAGHVASSRARRAVGTE